jgi:hypothetical protein
MSRCAKHGLIYCLHHCRFMATAPVTFGERGGGVFRAVRGPAELGLTLTGHVCSRSRGEASLGSEKSGFNPVRDVTVIPRVMIIRRERGNRDRTGQTGVTTSRRGFPVSSSFHRRIEISVNEGTFALAERAGGCLICRSKCIGSSDKRNDSRHIRRCAETSALSQRHTRVRDTQIPRYVEAPGY